MRSVLAVLGLVALPVWGETPPAHSMNIELERRDTGTFYIDGSITGYGDLEMLVDTGSSYLVISDAMLEDLKKSGAAEYSHELRGHMADGRHRQTKIYKLSGLRLGAGCWVSDVEAAVIPGTKRAILGMNILSRLAPFTLSTEPPQLQLHQCQGGDLNEVATAAPDTNTAP